MTDNTLIFSLIDLPRAIGSRKELQCTWEAPDDLGTPSMAVHPKERLDLDLEFISVDKGVLLRLRTEVDLHGQCVRCLDPVVQHHVIETTEVYVEAGAHTREDPEEDEDEEELRLIGPHDTIDVEPLLRDSIITLVDSRPLCSTECEGLCAQCGEKWSDLPSDHEHQEIDPRLAGLAVLLEGINAGGSDEEEAH